MDYNITTLLYEPQHRLKRIICDLYGELQKEDSDRLQNHVDEIFILVQHQFQKLIGSTNLLPHKLSFAIGNEDSDHVVGTCLIGELILRFFNECLPNTIDGKIKKYYFDIVEHSLSKVILYMCHNLRYRSQQL